LENQGLPKRIVPAFEWLLRYQRNDLRGDLSAGLVVAIMLVPQGMAYAMLAGLPPVVGLYASTFPLLAYALFGSSRQLAVGPVAMISLLVFAGLSPLADAGSPQYFHLALLLSLMVGVLQLALGLLRMGFLVNFLSHAVISGFTSAAAIIIWLSQVHHLLGVPASGGHSFLHLLEGLGRHIGQVHFTTMGIGLASVAFLLFFRRKMTRFPAPLVVVAGSTVLVYALGLDRLGVKVVGHVPPGLPAFSIPSIGLRELESLLPAAVTILLVGFMESISIAKLISAKEKYKVDSDQELKGLGLANLVGSFLSACPVTGGFSRTAVNYQAGARTGLAAMITSVLVLLTLLFFTPFFYYLPNAVLAAIVMVAVMGLVDVGEARRLFRVKKIDGWTLAVTFAATLALGSKLGIFTGVVLSLLVFIFRSAYPHAAELGYLEEEDVFRNIRRFPKAKVYPEVLILRIDASLYFANMAFVDDWLRKCIVEKPETKWVIFDLSGVNDVDAVAVDALGEIVENYSEHGIRFLFAGMKGPVRDLVARAGWEEKYGEAFQYPSLEQALKSIKKIPPGTGSNPEF
jgi:SulP family sulfate permease